MRPDCLPVELLYVRVEGHELAHAMAVRREDLLGAVQVAQPLLADVRDDQDPMAERLDALGMGEQPASGEHEPHQVGGVVANARRIEPPVLLAHGEGLGVGEDHVHVCGIDDEVTGAVEGLGTHPQAQDGVARGVDGDVRRVGACREEPVTDERGASTLVACGRRDAAKRAEQLDLLGVRLVGIGSRQLQDVLAHVVPLVCGLSRPSYPLCPWAATVASSRGPAPPAIRPMPTADIC